MLLAQLLAGLSCLVAAKNLGHNIRGHRAKGMSQQATECEFTYQIVQESTCDQVAMQNAMSLTVFEALNNQNPYIDCSDARNKIWPPVVVCIASQVFQDETGQAFNGTTLAKIALPGENSSNRPDFNGTMPLRRNLTTTTSTSVMSHTPTVSLPTDSSVTPLPTENSPPPACVPSTVCSLEQCGSTITDNCGNGLVCEACAPPPPPPPCNYDGTLGPCRYYADSDLPPNWRGYDVASECSGLTNYARQHYNPGIWDLQWDGRLAAYAYDSAVYSATYKCSHCHTNSGSGTTWGQNLYLGPCSCTDAYFGWVTNEARGDDPFNLDAAAININAYGHINHHIDTANFGLIDECNFTYQIKDNVSTCESVAGYNSVSTKVLQQLNTWLVCGSYIKQDTLVCVPSPPPVSTTTSSGSKDSLISQSVVPTLLPSGNGSDVVIQSTVVSGSASSILPTDAISESVSSSSIVVSAEVPTATNVFTSSTESTSSSLPTQTISGTFLVIGSVSTGDSVTPTQVFTASASSLAQTQTTSSILPSQTETTASEIPSPEATETVADTSSVEVTATSASFPETTEIASSITPTETIADTTAFTESVAPTEEPTTTAPTEDPTSAANSDPSPSPSPSPLPPVCVPTTTTCTENQCGTTITDDCGNPLVCQDCPCKPTTTCSANQCGQTITDNCGNQLTCPACPCVRNTKCSDSQCGTTIWDNCGNQLKCADCPCVPTQCNANQCGQTINDGCGQQIRCEDCPPPSFAQDCINNHNNERARYGLPALQWVDDIANNHAAPVAKNCAITQCWNCHQDSGPGTIFAQNMFLGHGSCSSAMSGWMGSAGHAGNILDGSYHKFGCGAYSTSNAQCIVCDFTW
ncbi:UNVERIFIED_CONTAM: hypothetical protein HDU68_011589 [Siphonaria sp. JEL0065]|nr:hypothetical protein HDU68_011589 [Siphonaria sp. JEL0065]